MKNKLILKMESPVGSLNLIHLTFPLILQQLSLHFLNSIHTITLTGVSAEAVSAVGITATLINVFNALLRFPAGGAAVLMSYALGRGDTKETTRIFSSAVYLAFCVSMILGVLICLFTPQIMSLYSIDGPTYEYAVVYLRIRALTFFLSCVTGCVLSALRCIGKTACVLLSNLSSSILNVLLCVLVVKDILPFQNKVAGVALAGVVGQVAALLVAVAFAVGKFRLVREIGLKRMKDILFIGFPGVCSSVSWNLSVSITTGFVAVLGMAAVNTRVFVNSILVYVPIFSNNLAAATSIMLGRMFGQGDLKTAKCLVRQNAIFVLLVNTSISVMLLFFCEPLMRLFTQDETIISAARILFLIDIGIEIWRCQNHIYGNAALASAKDVMFTSILGISSCWLVSVGGSWLFALQLGMGLKGCFLAAFLDEVVRATCHYLRWRSGAWKNKVLKR